MANALQLKKDERLSSTIELVQKMDTVFDILNVKAYGQGIRVSNTNRMEISSTEDPRFQVSFFSLNSISLTMNH